MRKNPVRTVLCMMGLTVLAKALGLARSLLFSASYGAGEEAAAFLAALSVPLTLFDLLLSAAVPGCFIPYYRGAEEEAEAKRFAAGFFTVTVSLCAALSAAGVLSGALLIPLAAPGLSDAGRAFASGPVRILFLSLPFIGGTAVLSAIHQAKGNYLLPAGISVLSNLLLSVWLAFFDRGSILLLSVLFLVSWGIQFFTALVPFLGQPLPKPSFRINGRMKKAFSSFLPVTLGAWLLPAGAFLGARFSSALDPAGNVRFDCAYQIFLLTGGILVYSLSQYLFPKFTGNAEKSAPVLLENGILAALALTLPAGFLLSALSGEAVSALYRHGAFTAADASASAAILRLLALFLPFFALNEVLSKAFYAAKKPVVPLFASLSGIGTDLVLSFFADKPSLTGAAFGAGLAVSASVMLLSLRLLPEPPPKRTAGWALWLLAASLPLFPAADQLRIFIGSTPETAGTIRNIVSCALTALPLLLLYACLLFAAVCMIKKARAKKSEKNRGETDCIQNKKTAEQPDQRDRFFRG